jgi:hypothetical protein
MNDNKAPTIFYVVLELQAEISRPIRGIVVEHNHLIFAELGLETAEVAIRPGRGRDVTRNLPESSSSFSIPA